MSTARRHVSRVEVAYVIDRREAERLVRASVSEVVLPPPGGGDKSDRSQRPRLGSEMQLEPPRRVSSSGYKLQEAPENVPT